MKSSIFMIILSFFTIFILSSCIHVGEQNNESPEPEVVEETDDMIPKAPEDNITGESDIEDDESEEVGGEGGEIGGPLVETEYTAGALVLDDFGSMMSISSPVTITGSAPRAWFFEAIFPVTLMTLEGEIITESYASGEWLSPVGDSEELNAEDMIEFSSTFEFEIPEGSTGEAKLRFSKDNTSGEADPEYVEEIVILVD